MMPGIEGKRPKMYSRNDCAFVEATTETYLQMAQNVGLQTKQANEMGAKIIYHVLHALGKLEGRVGEQSGLCVCMFFYDYYEYHRNNGNGMT